MIYLLFANWCARCGKPLTPLSVFASSDSPVIFLAHAECLNQHTQLGAIANNIELLKTLVDFSPNHELLIGYQKNWDAFVRCSILSDATRRIGFNIHGDIELWSSEVIKKLPLDASFIYSNGPFYRVVPYGMRQGRCYAVETYFLSFGNATPPPVFMKQYGDIFPPSIKRLIENTE